jgi:hypothetical protein
VRHPKDPDATPLAREEERENREQEKRREEKKRGERDGTVEES